jgi:3-phenylpropionate/cinnamic acid dioxygenase small subunit
MGDAETLFRLAALNTKYANCIDADRLEDWPGLFVEDCVYKIARPTISAVVMRLASSTRIRARC